MTNYIDESFALLQSDLEPFVEVYERMNKVLSTCVPLAISSVAFGHSALTYFENNNSNEVMIVDADGQQIISLPRNNHALPASYSNEDILRYFVSCENLVPLLLGRIIQLEQILCDSDCAIAKPILEELAEKL